jgi:hypothetical protein
VAERPPFSCRAPKAVRYDGRAEMLGRARGEGMAFQNLSRLKPDEIRSRTGGGENLLTIDVRTDGARMAQPIEIPGSHWLPLADVARHAIHLPRDATIVTYCT